MIRNSTMVDVSTISGIHGIHDSSYRQHITKKQTTWRAYANGVSHMISRTFRSTSDRSIYRTYTHIQGQKAIAIMTASGLMPHMIYRACRRPILISCATDSRSLHQLSSNSSCNPEATQSSSQSAWIIQSSTNSRSATTSLKIAPCLQPAGVHLQRYASQKHRRSLSLPSSLCDISGLRSTTCQVMQHPHTQRPCSKIHPDMLGVPWPTL